MSVVTCKECRKIMSVVTIAGAEREADYGH